MAELRYTFEDLRHELDNRIRIQKLLNAHYAAVVAREKAEAAAKAEAKAEAAGSKGDCMEYTFEQNTGGFNKIHYATAETAEAMAEFIRGFLDASCTVSVESEADVTGRLSCRELHIKSPTGEVRLNAGLVANSYNINGGYLAQLMVLSDLRLAEVMR